MSHSKLIPMIYTDDLQATVNFYVQTIGFQCISKEAEWARVMLDEVEMMIIIPSKQIAFYEPFFTGSFYIFTDNIDRIWEAIKDKTKVCYPMEDAGYGFREFAVYDNNGYLLQFGQQA